MIVLAAFGPLDWCVLAAYFTLLAVTGVVLSRRRETTEEYFLGGHRIPVWAASLSVLATAISAATFIGAPEESYKGDLTYLSTYIGSVIAAAIVALVFIPAFYRAKVGTVYQLLQTRFGTPSMLAASGMFLVGRTFASGAREYMAGLAGSWIIFGDSQPEHVVIAIVIMVVLGIAYTLVGGIHSVIWTDVIQSVFFVGAAVIAIGVLLWMIPVDVPQIISVLRDPGPATAEPSKLTVIKLGLDGFDKPYTFFTAIFGFSLISLGAFGTDHDLAQRMLTCSSARKGAWSAFSGIVVQIPVALLFLIVGLLLYVVYKRPDLMGSAALPPPEGASRDVFLAFIVDHMPPGVRGIMMSGLFAAGFASFISALNAMSSASVYDFYRRFRPGLPERHYVRAGQLGIIGWGLALGGFAVLSVYWQDHDHATLINFALKVMTFAYSGLVAVYLTALFTRRGNNASVIAALTLGFLSILALQLQPWTWWGAAPLRIAFPWQMTIATTLAFIVCLCGAAPRLDAR